MMGPAAGKEKCGLAAEMLEKHANDISDMPALKSKLREVWDSHAGKLVCSFAGAAALTAATIALCAYERHETRSKQAGMLSGGCMVGGSYLSVKQAAGRIPACIGGDAGGRWSTLSGKLHEGDTGSIRNR